MATRKAASPKVTAKAEQPKVASSEPVGLDAVATCEMAADLLRRIKDFKRAARRTQKNYPFAKIASPGPDRIRGEILPTTIDENRHRAYRREAQRVMKKLTPFVNLLEDLAGLLRDPSIVEALKAANNDAMVLVEGRTHPSYCRAAFGMGCLIYLEFLGGIDGPEACTKWLKIDQREWRFWPIDTRGFEGAWAGISQAIVQCRPGTTGDLCAQIRKEQSRVRKNWGRSPAQREETESSKPAKKLEWLPKALLILKDHPGWSDAKIAKKVGKHPSTLCKNGVYHPAAKAFRGSKTDRPSGYIKSNKDSKMRDVEAAAPPAGNLADKSDQGQPVPGSKLFLEYCSECGDRMRVPKDKVGTNPLCETCQNG